jgi:hypothetical protein
VSSSRGLIPAGLALAAAGAVTLGVVTLANSGQVNDALGEQWAVVNFEPDTPVSTVQAVRQACSDVPGVRPVTAPAVPSQIDVTYSLRYQTSKASGKDLAALRSCLSLFPTAVIGVSFQDVAGTG